MALFDMSPLYESCVTALFHCSTCCGSEWLEPSVSGKSYMAICFRVLCVLAVCDVGCLRHDIFVSCLCVMVCQRHDICVMISVCHVSVSWYVSVMTSAS